MKKIILSLCLIALAFSIKAQEENTAEEIAIRSAVESLFDAMRAGDSTMVRNCFHPNATMQTTFTDKAGKPRLEAGSIDGFCEAVGTPHEQVWDEKIWSYEIQVDDLLASVWTEYSFYLGERKMHCGVNAFLMFKSADGWKILSIMDTRRSEGCR